MSDTPGRLSEEIQWEILEEQMIDSLRVDPSDKTKPKKALRVIKSDYHIRITNSLEHSGKELEIFFDVNKKMRDNKIAEFNVVKATLDALGLKENIDYQIREFIPGDMDEKVLTIKKLDKLNNPKDIFSKTYDIIFQKLYPAKTTMTVQRDTPAKIVQAPHQTPIPVSKPHTLVSVVNSQPLNAQSMLDKVLKERDENEKAIKQTAAKERIKLSTITQFSEIKRKIDDEIFFGYSSSDNEQILRLKLISAELLAIRNEVLALTAVNPLSPLTASSSALAAKVKTVNVKKQERVNPANVSKIEVFQKSREQLMGEIRSSLANLKKMIDERIGRRKYFRWIPGILSTELQNFIKDTTKVEKDFMEGAVSLVHLENQLKGMIAKHGNTKFKNQIAIAISPVHNLPEIPKAKTVSTKQRTLSSEKPSALVFSNPPTEKLSTSNLKTKKKKKGKVKKEKGLEVHSKLKTSSFEANPNLKPSSKETFSFEGEEWTSVGPQEKGPKDPTTTSTNKRSRRRK